MTHRKGKKPQNRKGEEWTKQEEQSLKKLVKKEKNNPTGIIADLLGRTENAIRSKASELGVSLKPVNKFPYNRRKK